MTTLSPQTAKRPPLLPHLLAGFFALFYAWAISNTAFVTTGLQFVFPVAIILLIHIGWLIAQKELYKGFANIALGRTLATAIAIIALTTMTAIIAPPPAEANDFKMASFEEFLAVIACLAVLALVVGTIAGILYAIVRIIYFLAVYVRKRSGSSGGDTRLFDFGAITVAFIAIGATSLEGTSKAFTFATADRTSTTLDVAASPHKVWQQVAIATSPQFPIPFMLHTIPRPVAIIVDEGASLGNRRIVRFKGREGIGDLVLKVTRRTDTEAVYTVMSDASPIAAWARGRSVTFRVIPSGTGTKLSVIADYDRLLSPAWFFRPYMRVAVYLGTSTLARDTKERAERNASTAR